MTYSWSSRGYRTLKRCLPPLTDMFQVLNVVGMGFVGTEVANGLGRKRYYLEPASYKKFLKYDYLDWVQVFLTLMISKISICLFLLRLSSFRKIRLGLHAMNIFLITSHIPLTFLIVFQCSPISKYWRNPHDGPGKCFSKDAVARIIIVQGGQFFSAVIILARWDTVQRQHYVSKILAASDINIAESGVTFFSTHVLLAHEAVVHAQSMKLIHSIVFSIVSDFILAGFPIVLLWNVQLGKRTKLGLCMLMGLGVM